MALAVGSVVLVSHRGTCFGQRIIMTHTYRVRESFPEPSTDAANLNTIIDTIIAAGTNHYTTQYLACLPAQYSLDSIRAQKISPTRTAYVQRSMGLDGTNEADATVANDAAALTFRTALAGRNQTATKHIGPIPDSVSVAGMLGGGYITLLANLGNQMKLPIVAGVGGPICDPVIYHRATTGTDFIDSFIVGPQSRVQRRRTVGLGE